MWSPLTLACIIGGSVVQSRSRIHERTISLRFLDIILRVLRLEVSVYNVYITKQFQTTFAQGRGNPLVDVSVNKRFFPVTFKNLASGIQ